MSAQTTVDPTRFRHLLQRWNAHQTLRSSGASVATLARSRQDLDGARHALRATL